MFIHTYTSSWYNDLCILYRKQAKSSNDKDGMQQQKTRVINMIVDN